VVQVAPIKSKLKAPGTERLIREYDNMVSRCAFKFNLRRYAAGNGSESIVQVLLFAGAAVNAGPARYCSSHHPTHSEPLLLE
jgi:hypothetical protein